MSQKPDGRTPQKTREEIKAEREAKKLAKAAAKAGKAKAKVAGGAACGTAAATANNCKIPEKDASTKENHRANIETDKDKSIECANATTSTTLENSEKNAISEKKRHVEESRVAVEELKEAKEVEEAKETKETKEAKEAKDQRLNGSVENGASEGDDNEQKQGKSKAELRAERRAKQEAQRAAKLQKDNAAKEPVKSVKPCVETAVSSQCPANKNVTKSATKENAHELNLFKHLYDERELSSFNVAVNSRIHPAIIRLGVQYANRVVVGSNARCVALLAAIKQVVRDFVKPAQADFVRGLEVSLQESLAYLHHCRPLAVSMKNAMRHLKCQMVRFSSSWLDEEVN